MKLFFAALVVVSSTAYASQYKDLEPSEVNAANFLAQCSEKISGYGYEVVSGMKGTFAEGVIYSFKLKDEALEMADLEVEWDKATRTYKCTLHKD